MSRPERQDSSSHNIHHYQDLAFERDGILSHQKFVFHQDDCGFCTKIESNRSKNHQNTTATFKKEKTVQQIQMTVPNLQIKYSDSGPISKIDNVC